MTEHYCNDKWVKGKRVACFMKKHEVKLQRSGKAVVYGWIEDPR